jgi:hypothetical protein
MLKKYFFFYLIFAAISLFGIFSSDDFSNKDYINHGYTDKLSYYPGDTVKVFVQPHQYYKKAQIKILDEHYNKKLVHKTGELQLQEISNPDPWAKGYGYKESFQYVIPENIISGIYFFEGKIPFLVKAKQPAEITIVYPHNTLNTYSNAGGRNFYNNEKTGASRTDTFSFLRPFAIGLYPATGELIRWMRNTEINFSMISDHDLEDPEYFKNIKILIIAGVNQVWTENARNNFENYIDAGGNALIFSANTMFWNTRYNKDRSQMFLFKDCGLDFDQSNTACSWEDKGRSHKKTIVTSINYGGYPSNDPLSFNGFKILSASSPLLKGSGKKQGDILSIRNLMVDGIDIEEISPNFKIKDSDFLDCYQKEIIGYEYLCNEKKNQEMAGTFIVFRRKQNSGIIINTASSDWSSEKGLNGPDSTAVRIITNNMLEILLQNKRIFSSNQLYNHR